MPSLNEAVTEIVTDFLERVDQAESKQPLPEGWAYRREYGTVRLNNGGLGLKVASTPVQLDVSDLEDEES